MTNARREIFNPTQVGVYHCVTRCVRRAFLCGFDVIQGQSFEHRREWVRKRLRSLTQIFSIEVVAYAVMSNHLHSLVRNRPDLAKTWTNREVALRWRRLFPKKGPKGVTMEPSEMEIQEITSDQNLVEIYRERLSSISWFNRCLNENIARRANYEDNCKGRFWEGRFKCQRIFDISGVLACCVYIDLNPIRAGIADKPESSDYTSVQQRIAALRTTRGTEGLMHQTTIVPLVGLAELTDGRLTTEQYLELVDDTGRAILAGKCNISPHLDTILNRLRISSENWIATTENFRSMFKRVVGPKEYLLQAAAQAKKWWFQGLYSAQQAFA